MNIVEMIQENEGEEKEEKKNQRGKGCNFSGEVSVGGLALR